MGGISLKKKRGRRDEGVTSEVNGRSLCQECEESASCFS